MRSFWNLAASVAMFIALTLSAAPSQAQTTSLCVTNFGDVPVRLGVIYSDGLGGFVLSGWYEADPQRQGLFYSCDTISQGGTFSNRYYVAIRQAKPGERFAHPVAFDVDRVTSTEIGTWPNVREIGATVVARPRQTEETRQGHSETGGRSFWTCFPDSGELRVREIVETKDCRNGLFPTLVTMRIDAPLNGGLFDRNEYKLHVYPVQNPVYFIE